MKRALFFSALLWAAPARGDDAQKEACAAAYDTSQVLRDEGKLLLAREQLVVCERACPAKLAKDCGRWRGDIDKNLASVVLGARDGSGAPVAAWIAIDGRPAEPVGAGEVVLEPGVHRFHFERPADGAVIEKSRQLARGDKRVAIDAIFGAPANKPWRATGVQIGGFALLGVGTIMLGGALGLAIKGHVDRGRLFDCKPNCDPADVSAIKQKWDTAGVIGSVGAVMFGLGLGMVLVSEANKPKDAVSLTADGIAVAF